jgi:putative ABC transport system permease protein
LLPDLTNYKESIILIRIKDKGERKIYTDVLSTLEQFWKKLDPDTPFEYYFVDAIYDQLYKTEERMSKIFLWFTTIAILLSCLGLFGLASFTAERKTKEIGIRKTLGASVSNIVFMLSKNFLQWVIMANLIAWPVAYYFINKWLEDFAYRIDLSWWFFVLAGGIALVIALLTVSFQAIKAATANPVKSLRYE